MQPWFQFEDEICARTELFGYRSITTPPSGDDGVDVLAEKNGRRVAIQVKLFTNRTIGRPTLVHLLGGMRVYGASEGLLLTTSKLTKKAVAFCKTHNLFYHDRDTLFQLLCHRGVTLPAWTYMGDFNGRHNYPLYRGVFVGREFGCEVRVPEDPLLSRVHFKIESRGLALIIEDLQSKNGTLVNQQRLTAPIELRYGDHIQAGQMHWKILPGNLAF